MFNLFPPPLPPSFTYTVVLPGSGNWGESTRVWPQWPQWPQPVSWPRVKAIEYDEHGNMKRVEYYDEKERDQNAEPVQFRPDGFREAFQ